MSTDVSVPREDDVAYATIVSVFPQEIKETKPGLIPDTFIIPKSDGKNPQVLHVKDVNSALYIGDGKTFRLTHSFKEIATSIVEDFCNGFIEADADRRPGIFWIPGKHSKENVVKQFPKQIADAIKRQNLWLQRLVISADDDYQKHGQVRGISDLQRMAAFILGLTNKPWYVAPEPITYVKCDACSTMVDSSAAICHNCKHPVNIDKALSLGLIDKARADALRK